MGHDILMAGFGGQGLMAIGKLLAKAAMREGKHVTWLPSYGPEMRGGTANCIVVIDDNPIGSPYVRHPRAAIAMNRPSLDKFEPLLAPGAVVLVNASLIERKVARPDVKPVYVPANALAEAAGLQRAANMAMLGAYVAATRAVQVDSVEACIAAGKTKTAVAGNLAAFRKGVALVQQTQGGG